MAGGLGILLGAGLGIGKAVLDHKNEQQKAVANMMIQQGMQSGDPSIWEVPEVKSAVSKVYGKDTPMMLGHVAKAMSAPLQGMPQMGGGGGSATPSAPPSATNQMIGAAGGGGQVQPVASGPNSQQGQVAQATIADPQQQQRTIDPAHGDPNTPEAINSHMDAVREWAKTLPANARVQAAAKDEIEYWQKRLESTQKQQDYESTRADRQTTHEDTEADKAATRAMQAQNHSDSIAMQRDFHGFMQQMAMAKSDEDRNVHFQNASKNLSSQTANIAKMLTGATPADPDTVKTLLDQRNAQAKMLRQQAEKNGIDYDPEEFAPLTTRQVPGWLKSYTEGMIGGDKTTIAPADATAEARPAGVGADWTQGSVKGKQAWISPDKKSAVFIGG